MKIDGLRITKELRLAIKEELGYIGGLTLGFKLSGEPDGYTALNLAKTLGTQNEGFVPANRRILLDVSGMSGPLDTSNLATIGGHQTGDTRIVFVGASSQLKEVMEKGSILDKFSFIENKR